MIRKRRSTEFKMVQILLKNMAVIEKDMNVSINIQEKESSCLGFSAKE